MEIDSQSDLCPGFEDGRGLIARCWVRLKDIPVRDGPHPFM
jgi:hypothetical protein